METQLFLIVLQKLQLLISWSPAINGDFMTKGSRAPYWEFQYTLYSPQLIQLLVINIIFYVITELFFIMSKLSNQVVYHYYIAAAVLAHVLFILLQYAAKNFFQKIYYMPAIASLVMLSYILNSYISYHLIASSYNVLVLLISVFYLQNSTLLTMAFIFIQCIITLYSYFISSSRLTVTVQSSLQNDIEVVR